MEPSMPDVAVLPQPEETETPKTGDGVSDDRWLSLFERMVNQQTAASEKQTDRLVEAFKTESAANRQAIAALQAESHTGLTEVRSVVNRNTLALVAVALVGFIALVAVASGATLGLNLGPDGIEVTPTEVRAEP